MTAASELGPRLRTLRERQGIAVPKVADELHLDAWIVEALEAGQFERVGAPVYAKGHLRRYAALLGLPDGEVTAAIESLMAPAPAVELLEPAPYTALPARFASGLPWRPIATLAGLAIIVIGVLWWKPWRLHPRATPAAVTTQVGATPPAAAMPPSRTPAPAAPAPRGAVAAAPARPRKAIAAQVRGGAANVGHLRLEFSSASWAEVRDATGKRVFRGIARAGTSQLLSGRAPFAIVLGYQRGVKVQIDGRTAKIADSFVQGNVARFQAGADGALHPYAAPPPRR